MAHAIIYARVSSTEQAQGWSITTQLEACRKYAGQHDLEVAAEYSDVETGATLERAGFQQVMRELRAGRAGALVVYQGDRLHRDLLHALQTRRELKLLGIDLYTVRRGKAGDTPEAEFTDAIDDLVAEMERKRIAERTTRGKRGKALSGLMVGNGPAPYGYRYIGQGRERALEIDPAHAPTVRQIFQWYAWGDDNGPVSVSEIAKRLRGTPTPSDVVGRERYAKKRAVGEWAAAHIYPILRNTTYSGQFHAFRTRRVGKSQRVRPDDQHIIVPVPAMVDASTWEATQQRVARGRELSPRQAKHSYLLGRRIRCRCGLRAHGRATQQGARLWYVCNGRIRSVTVTPCPFPLPWFRAEPVDAAVWGYLADLLGSDEKIARALAEKRAEVLPTADRDDLLRQRQRLERQKTTLLDMLLADEIDRPTWRQRSQAVEAQIATVVTQIAALPEPPPPDTGEQTALEFAATIRPGLSTLSFAGRRRVIDALDVSVTLHPDKRIEITSIFGIASVSIV